MRKKNWKQMLLMPWDIEHPRAGELDRISNIPDCIPTITDRVLQDRTHLIDCVLIRSPRRDRIENTHEGCTRSYNIGCSWMP